MPSLSISSAHEVVGGEGGGATPRRCGFGGGVSSGITVTFTGVNGGKQMKGWGARERERGERERGKRERGERERGEKQPDNQHLNTYYYLQPQ